jgi:UrcA family protein
MSQLRKTVTTISATIVLLGFTGLATGGEPPPGRRVAAADLDLSKAEDADVLYGRIQTAARSLCRAEKARWDVKSVLHQRQCVDSAVADAVGRAREPRLTAVHRAERERVASLEVLAPR